MVRDLGEVLASLRRLLGHGGAEGRRQLRIAVALIALATVADVVSLGLLQRGTTAMHDTDPGRLSRGLGLLGWFLAAAMLASVLRMVAARYQVTGQYALTRALAARAFASLQMQSYADYLRRGPSEGIAAFEHLQLVLYNALNPLITVTTTALSAVVLCAAVFALYPAAGAVLFAGLALAAVEGIWRGVRDADAGHAAPGRSRARLLFESRTSFRDIFLANAQARMCADFIEQEGAFREQQARTARSAQSSRYGIEIAAFGVALMVLAVVGRSTPDWRTTLPALGIVAVAAFRLLPQAALIRGSLRQIGVHGPMTADMTALLDRPAALPVRSGPAVLLQHSLEMRRITVLRDGRPNTLDGLDLVIPRGGRIGIRGASGAGKSTLLDVLCAAVLPDRGTVLVDGHAMTAADGVAWRERIGFVGQNPLLLGATLREAVIFPQRIADCDPDRFGRSVEQAGVAAMATGFEQGLDTPVGEALTRLSGGQRQRLALAHALYRARDLLILDEATGQLDPESEAGIVAVIGALPRWLTIVIVSHRVAPFAHCDSVYRLENGRLYLDGAKAPDRATNASQVATSPGTSAA